MALIKLELKTLAVFLLVLIAFLIALLHALEIRSARPTLREALPISNTNILLPLLLMTVSTALKDVLLPVNCKLDNGYPKFFHFCGRTGNLSILLHHTLYGLLSSECLHPLDRHLKTKPLIMATIIQCGKPYT